MEASEDLSSWEKKYTNTENLDMKKPIMLKEELKEESEEENPDVD